MYLCGVLAFASSWSSVMTIDLMGVPWVEQLSLLNSPLLNSNSNSSSNGSNNRNINRAYLGGTSCLTLLVSNGLVRFLRNYSSNTGI